MQGMDTKVIFEEKVDGLARPATQLTTGFVSLLVNNTGATEEVVGLEIVNTTAGAVTFSVEVIPFGEASGVTKNLVIDAQSVAAHTRVRVWSKIEPFYLANKDDLRIKASAATSLNANLLTRPFRA